jgi:hypothetical protein
MQGATQFVALSANIQWNKQRPDSTRAKLDGVGSAACTPPGAAVAAGASRTSVASGPPAASPAAASHNGSAGGRSLLLSICDGDGPSLGGGGQAVSSDGEGSQIPGVYLPQLCPQSLRETLHEEI